MVELVGANEGINVKKLAMLLVSILLQVACGGGSGKSTPNATSADSATTSSAATAAVTQTPVAATNAATPAGATPAATSAAASATPATAVDATTPATQAAAAVTAQPSAIATNESVDVATEAPTEAAPGVPTAASTVASIPVPTEVASVGQPTQDQLTTGLLVVSDMPDGWSDVPPDPAADAEPVGFCKPDAESGIEQIRANGAFQQPDQALYLQETLIGFAPGGSAAWMDWVKPTVNCEQVTDDSVDPPVIYQVTPLGFTAVGDQMLAYRLSVSDPTLGEIAYDIVYSRVGNCVAAIANLALGTANSDLTQSAAQSAVNRARPVCG
jgi:hypothetical protein